MMPNNVGRLGVVLGLNTAEFITGLNTAGRALEKFGEAAEKYGKLALTAMAAAGLQALSFADELNDVAKANDTTIESVVRLQQALTQNGGSAETAGKMLAGFTRYVDEAANGSMDAQKRLASMGVTLKDIATLGTQDLFNKALQGSANTADSLTRHANAMAVFGKAVKGVDIKGVSEDYSAANGILKEQAARIKDAADAWDVLKISASEASASIASGIGPSMLALLDYLKDIRGETNLLGEAFRITFETIVVLAANVATQFIDIGISLSQTMLMIKAFIPGTEVEGKWSEFEKKREENLARYAALVKRVIGEQDFLTGEKSSKYFEGHLGVKVPSTGSPDGRPVIDAYAKETKQLTAKLTLQKQLFDIDKMQNALRLESINGEKTSIDLRGIELQLAMSLANIANARSQALSNEKLNAEQKRLINQDFNLQEKTANAKATASKEYIIDLDEKILGLYAEQGVSRQIMLDIDSEIAVQQLASINMDKLQADNQANVLQYKKEVLRINTQERESLEKVNLSETERNKIRVEAEDSRAKASQVFSQTNSVITKQYQDQIEAVGRLKLAENESYAFDVRRQILEQNKYHMRVDEIKLAEEQITSEQKIADLRRQQMEVTRTMGSGDIGNAEINRIEDLISKELSLSNVRKKSIEDEYDRTQSFSAGWDEAYRNYIEQASNAAAVGAQAFNSVIGNMNSALDNFVNTGKFSFSNLANSIIKDLIRIQLKAQVTSLFNSVFGGAGGGGGGTAGGGGAGAGGVPGIPSGMMMADGGSPPVGLATMVGERGPELFVPHSSGTVIPNNQLSSMMGDGGQTINYNGPYIANMSAIDTQTGMQFLAKNKQTIWASYQSANRSMPVSR